jgi:hypothetical protein
VGIMEGHRQGVILMVMRDKRERQRERQRYEE